MGKLILIIGIIIACIVVLLIASFVKAPPSVAFIVSGAFHKNPKIIIGRGGFRIPFLQRLDRLFLGQVTVDIKTKVTVPTKDFINVNADAVAKVQVSPDSILLAAKNFLNMSAAAISQQVQDSLEGNMREVIGSITLRDININRDAFSDAIMDKAQKDMNALGLYIISCNIQNVTDEQNLIHDLGADNTWGIRKDAAVTKANAERDIAKAQAEAAKEANAVKVAADTDIAERQNDLKIKKAELQVESDIKQADADAAYAIQQQKQQKVINTETVEAEAAKQLLTQQRKKEINAATIEAETEKARREQELTAEQVQIKQNQLDAEVKKRADADKYDRETLAAAALEQHKRAAEADAYKAEQEARAQIALAEAKKQQMVLEAEGIKAQGEAEAYAIQQKGLAEAEAMEKKADAFEKYGAAAKLDMLREILPAMATAIAQPLSTIKDIHVFGNGTEASNISGNVPVLMAQTMKTLESIGIPVGDIIKSETIQARTDRNIALDAEGTQVNITEK